METFVRRQAFLIVLSFALGGILGFGYDLVRPFRRRCGGFARGLIDFAFCLAAASALFVFTMSAGDGKLGLWELCFALTGFLSYLYTVSDTVFAFFDRLLEKLTVQGGKIRSGMEKAENSAKKTFKKIRKCYMIKDRT